MSRPTWLIAALLALPMATAAQDAAPPAEGPATPRRPVNEVLQEPVDVTVSPGQPLPDVFNALADKHGFAIEFPAEEGQVPKNVDREVTLRGVELGTAMGILLSPTGLVWTIRDDTLVVAKRETVALPAADRIRAALRQESRLEFPRTPFREALNFLADIHDINIVIDEQAMTDAGISVDDNVDIVLKGVTLEAALNLLLEQWGMQGGATYVVTNDVLLVTTADRADREIDTRSYDVSAVVGENGYATEAAENLARLLEPRSTLAGAMITAGGGAAVPLPQPRIVPFKQRLLVTASWADHRRLTEILRLMETSRP